MYPDKLNNIENDDQLLSVLEQHVQMHLAQEIRQVYPAALLDRLLTIAKKIAYRDKISDTTAIFDHFAQGQKYSIKDYAEDVAVLKEKLSESGFHLFGKFTAHTIRSVVAWIKENQ